MQQSDALIAEMAGVDSGLVYLDDLFTNADTVFSSCSAILAILAAGKLAPSAAVLMLPAIQYAHTSRAAV